MKATDPIQTAKTLIRLGLTTEAMTTLERASAQDPGRIDITRAIAELRHATSAAGRAWLVLDIVMIWLLMISVGAVVAWLGYECALAVGRWWMFPDADWVAPAIFGAVVVGCFVYAWIWVHMFLHAWFCYLKYVSRANRAQVEMCLPSYFRLMAVEPQYSQLRARYFGN